MNVRAYPDFLSGGGYKYFKLIRKSFIYICVILVWLYTFENFLWLWKAGISV